MGINSPQLNSQNTAIWLLKFAAICLLIGRAWQHFFWTTPYAAILPFEDLQQLKTFNLIIGSVLLSGAMVLVFYNKSKIWQKVLLQVITGILFLIALAYWATKEYRFTQLFEYSAQVGIIPLLQILLSEKFKYGQIRNCFNIMIAFTFTAHGLYAIGFPYATPAGFIEMTVKILAVDTGTAKVFLSIVGVLDLLLSIGIFIKRTEKAALMYAFLWGSLTALARVVAYFDMLSPISSLHRWLYETVHRIPHAILPLALLVISGYLVISMKKEKILS